MSCSHWDICTRENCSCLAEEERVVVRRDVDAIVAQIAKQFPAFGRGTVHTAFPNSLSEAMKDRAPVFATGVDIRAVVGAVLTLARQSKG